MTESEFDPDSADLGAALDAAVRELDALALAMQRCDLDPEDEAEGKMFAAFVRRRDPGDRLEALRAGYVRLRDRVRAAHGLEAPDAEAGAEDDGAAPEGEVGLDDLISALQASQSAKRKEAAPAPAPVLAPAPKPKKVHSATLLRRRRAAEGKCLDCANTPAMPGKRRCEVCLEKVRAQGRERNVPTKRKRYRCGNCGDFGHNQHACGRQSAVAGANTADSAAIAPAAASGHHENGARREITSPG